MLPRCVLLLSCLLLFSGPVWAAEIYGQIWEAPQELPRGAVVTSSCGGEVEVDPYGRYRLINLPLGETCILTISYKQRESNPVHIYTADNRNSANFMLKISGDRLLLIRR